MAEQSDRATEHEDFGLPLLVLVRAYRASVGAVVDGIPHGPRGYQTLAAVVRGEQPSQLALANHLCIDRTVMTYLIDDLEGAGLVERQQNPEDRRQRKIVPTDRGTSVFVDLQRRVHQAEDALLSSLDDPERQTFRRLINRATADLRDSGTEMSPEQPDPNC